MDHHRIIDLQGFPVNFPGLEESLVCLPCINDSRVEKVATVGSIILCSNTRQDLTKAGRNHVRGTASQLIGVEVNSVNMRN